MTISFLYDDVIPVCVARVFVILTRTPVFQAGYSNATVRSLCEYNFCYADFLLPLFEQLSHVAVLIVSQIL